MPVQSKSPEDPAVDTDEAPPTISACETCPGTVVFLETDNADGWIATDAAVELQR